MTKINEQGIEIADTIKERKYIVVSQKFVGVSSAAIPCDGQIATNSKLLAYILYRKWRRFSLHHEGYSIAVSLYKRNERGLYDAIKR